VTLALSAVVFTVRPQTSATRLARAFFCLYNLVLPVTMLALSFESLGPVEWMPVVIAGQLLLYAAAMPSVANLIIRVRGAPAAAAGRPGVVERRQRAAPAAGAR
jgi:hypothetical protein